MFNRDWTKYEQSQLETARNQYVVLSWTLFPTRLSSFIASYNITIVFVLELCQYNIYIYIYIYLCVCVCVCVCGWLSQRVHKRPWRNSYRISTITRPSQKPAITKIHAHHFALEFVGLGLYDYRLLRWHIYENESLRYSTFAIAVCAVAHYLGKKIISTDT